jgi:DNA-binding GntR family transcriptional regulator
LEDSLPPEKLTAGDLAKLLRERIRIERPAAGQQLESDDEIAARYRVTKNVARRAWGHLAREGLVTRQHGAGTFMGDGVPKPTLEDRVAELERRVAEAPTRDEMDELRQHLDAVLAERSIDAEPATSATPARKRRTGT